MDPVFESYEQVACFDCELSYDGDTPYTAVSN